MKTVYKYPLTPYTSLQLPKDAQIIKVDSQHNNLFLWALIDLEEKEHELREFMTFGTGHPIPDEKFNFKYIGTSKIDEVGSPILMFHTFEVLKPTI